MAFSVQLKEIRTEFNLICRIFKDGFKVDPRLFKNF